MEDTYKTISAESEGYFKDKGSKFLAYAFPIKTEEEVKDILVKLKKDHHSARHHCYAWRLGATEPVSRANDDSEPSSTAGKPILGQLIKYDVTNILIVVVRYFGGILLGTGGLINAYKTAAADALNNANIITITIEKKLRLSFTYNEMNEVMQVVKQENLTISETRFELNCMIVISTRKSEIDKVKNLFTAIKGLTILCL